MIMIKKLLKLNNIKLKKNKKKKKWMKKVKMKLEKGIKGKRKRNK